MSRRRRSPLRFGWTHGRGVILAESLWRAMTIRTVEFLSLPTLSRGGIVTRREQRVVEQPLPILQGFNNYLVPTCSGGMTLLGLMQAAFGADTRELEQALHRLSLALKENTHG